MRGDLALGLEQPKGLDAPIEWHSAKRGSKDPIVHIKWDKAHTIHFSNEWHSAKRGTG
jgi:hypothetical protein